MSQLRKNSITGEWVVFAENRHHKPYHFRHRHEVTETGSEDCPFCPGHEDQTPPETDRLPSQGPWQVRVFPNKYPAMTAEKTAEKTDGFYESLPGWGAHRVLVDTPVHTQGPEQFSLEHWQEVFTVLARQQLELEQKARYVQIFKNNGPMAGASVPHSHWQMLSSPVILPRQERTLEHLQSAKKEQGVCLYCAMGAHEAKLGDRMVAENDSFWAFVPYAARFAFEIWVLPKRHVPTFPALTTQERWDLAKITKELLLRVKALRPGMDYNLCLEDSPLGPERKLFHWHLEILPRMGALAGFEYATASFLNPVLPETAAAVLREKA